MTRLHRRVAAVLVAATVWAAPAVGHAADGTYTVEPGDSLIGIAAGNGISLSTLLSANQLTLTSVIHPGRQLTIPGSPASGQTSAPAATGASTYTVRWGDTLFGIASRSRVSLSALLAANNMTVTSLITPGMKLRLPAGAATPSNSTPTSAPAATPAATHTVKWGDTLSGIARTYGVSLSSLLTANGMSFTSLIMPGMNLRLPAGAAAAAAAPTTGTPAGPSVSTTSQTGTAKVVAYALAQQGKPYRFFTKGPDTFDCSGLTLAAYAQVGVKLIHYSAAQALQGTAVDFHNEPIRPGDLVFLATRGRSTINHVGIAINSTSWVHAVGEGTSVRIGRLPSVHSITSVRRYIAD